MTEQSAKFRTRGVDPGVAHAARVGMGFGLAELARDLRTEREAARVEQRRLDAALQGSRLELALAQGKLEESQRLVGIQQAQLSRARDKALASTRAKAGFLAMISHEIRTPLNGILGMTDCLLASKLGAAEREQAQTIQRAGRALMGLINDVLDFSKGEAGRVELESVDFELRQEIENAVELVAQAAQLKGIDLSVRIDAAVPERVAGDPVRLRQVLLNLLANAVKFTAEGEVAVDVALDRSDDREDVISLEVRDTGIGIARDRVAALFEPFVQADASTTRRFGGTGLGLAICKQLVELMAGRIDVDSQLGLGSSFTVHIPFRPASAGARLEGVDSVPHFAGVWALVLDRNRSSRQILGEQLERMGLDVAQAEDLREGVEQIGSAAAEEADRRVVFVDYRTAEEDLGLAARFGVAASSNGASLVLLAPMVHRATSEELLGASVAASITKPVRRRLLVAALERVVDGVDACGVSREHPRPQRVLRVLVVEDNPINQRVALGLLAKTGHAGEVAQNGVEGLSRLRSESFDLVLLDCQMPEMDGFEMAQILRREEGALSSIPIVAMTAHTSAGNRERCLEVGMNDYVAKPLTLEVLERVLEHYAAEDSGIPS